QQRKRTVPDRTDDLTCRADIAFTPAATRDKMSPEEDTHDGTIRCRASRRAAAFPAADDGAAHARTAGSRRRGAEAVECGPRRSLRDAALQSRAAAALSHDGRISAPEDVTAQASKRDGDPAGGAYLGCAIRMVGA